MLTPATAGEERAGATGSFQTSGRAADSDRLTGALIVTFALIAMAEVGRSLRLLNVLFAGWLLVAPWVLDGFSAGAKWNDLLSAALLIGLSIRRGKIRGSYGSWQAYIG